MQKIIIGRKDKVSLPEFGLKELNAKIDTGAYRSALHCHEVESFLLNGEEVLRFKLLDPSHPEYEDRFCYAHTFRQRKVKSSSGTIEERYVITTTLTIFNREHQVEFSLTDREAMKHPLLLGRKFLSHQFLVDVNKSNLSFKLNNKK
ncbi:MAG: RimK/LysX family protein [Cyclobacteriaceae bacterium]|nr:RimK/LysX family protein [Cyclobacteriaceae bacterium]